MSESAVAPGLVLSESAATRIKRLRDMEQDSSLMLRVTVSGGGCSGFQYAFSLDKTVADDDLVFEQHGVGVVIDEVSLGLLDGSVVDYVESLVGAAFQIRNPNAASTCGCGSSFAV